MIYRKYIGIAYLVPVHGCLNRGRLFFDFEKDHLDLCQYIGHYAIQFSRTVLCSVVGAGGKVLLDISSADFIRYVTNETG